MCAFSDPFVCSRGLYLRGALRGVGGVEQYHLKPSPNGFQPCADFGVCGFILGRGNMGEDCRNWDFHVCFLRVCNCRFWRDFFRGNFVLCMCDDRFALFFCIFLNVDVV